MRWPWLVLIAVGVVVRLVIWWVSVGSNDVLGWASHAHNIANLGLAETYKQVQIYNHPPLMGWYSVWVTSLAPGDILGFARGIKLPGMIGEAIAMVVLGRLGGVRLAGLYALLPAPIFVAAYHGNTDCLYAALALVAALAWDRRRYALAGLTLAAALNVKLIPLVLLPLFVLAAPSWGALVRFSLMLGIGLLPFLPPALEAGAAMHRNMVAYNSSADEWGFLAILNDAERLHALQGIATPVRDAFLAAGRYLIMGSALLVALASRFRLRLSMCEQVALASALFLFFAPGFGVQYVVFVVPALLAVNLRAGVFWGVASGIFIGSIYAIYLVDGPRWYSSFRAPYPGWTPEIGLVAWAGLGVWVWQHLAGAWRRSAPGRAPGTTTPLPVTPDGAR